MLEQTGTVRSLENEYAWIETQSRSACSACGTDSCSTSVIAKLFGIKRNHLRVPNTLNLQVGQQVVIGIEDSVVVKASLLAYLLPPVSMILTLALVTAVSNDALSQILAAVIGLALGLNFTGYITGSPKVAQQHMPKVLRTVPSQISAIDMNTLLRTSQ